MKAPKTIALYGYVPIPGRSIGYIVYVGESELAVAQRAVAEAYGRGARLEWIDRTHAEVVRPDQFGVRDVLVDKILIPQGNGNPAQNAGKIWSHNNPSNEPAREWQQGAIATL
jgi:hypothetical protein